MFPLPNGSPVMDAERCTVGQKKKRKKKKHPYLFQYKLSYRNETGSNHHGLLSTSV